MIRFFALTALITCCVAIKSNAQETVPFQTVALTERFGDSNWQLIELGDQRFAPTYQSEPIVMANGQFHVVTPCGTVALPIDLDATPPDNEPRAAPQPCIALHTIAYDVIYVLRAATEITVLPEGSLVIESQNGRVALRQINDN